MAATSRNRDVFDFFGLPRELRDLIYAELLVGMAKIECEDGRSGHLTIFVRNLPMANIALVNHQLHEEYSWLATKAGPKLLVEDRMTEGAHCTSPAIPDRFHGAHHLELNLFAYCFEDGQHDETDLTCTGVEDDIRNHQERLNGLAAQLPRLQSVDVAIHITRGSNTRPCIATIKAASQNLASISSLRSLNVYQNGTMCSDAVNWDYSIGEEPTMRWISGTSLLEEMEYQLKRTLVRGPSDLKIAENGEVDAKIADEGEGEDVADEENAGGTSYAGVGGETEDVAVI